MKKLLVFIIALCLVLALTIGMVACGDNGNQGKTNQDGDTNQGGDNGNTNQGGDNNGNQGGENGNTNQGDDQGNTGNNGENGNQGGDNQGTATVYTVTLATRDSIYAAIGDTYKVTAIGLLDNSSTTVAADGTYFYASAPYESFSKKIGDTYLYPYGFTWDGKYHKMGTPTFSADGRPATMLGHGHVLYLSQFDGETLSYNTVDNVSFLDRPAKKYTFESTNAYGYNLLFHEEVIIDDATGACLRYEGYGRGGDGFMGSTRDKVSFEVTEFSYGAGNVSARAFLDGYINKIDIAEWESAFITAVGLAAVDAPQGELWFSQWDDHHYSRDSATPYWQAQYKLYSDMQAEYQDYIRTYCRAFYDAGAKLGSGKTQAEFDDLYSSNGDEWDDVNLTAYVVGNTDYIVYINATYNSRTTNRHWLINVEICKESD